MHVSCLVGRQRRWTTKKKQDCWQYRASSLGSVAPPGLEMCCAGFPRTAPADADLSWAKLCRPFGAGFVAQARPGRGTTAGCAFHASWAGNAGGRLTQCSINQPGRTATGCGHLSHVNTHLIAFMPQNSSELVRTRRRRSAAARHQVRSTCGCRLSPSWAARRDNTQRRLDWDARPDTSPAPPRG